MEAVKSYFKNGYIWDISSEIRTEMNIKSKDVQLLNQFLKGKENSSAL